MKLSEHACKIFFNYSKLCVISFFAKKVQFLPPKHASLYFSTNSRNIIARNLSKVIPLLANHDLTPMLCELGLRFFCDLLFVLISLWHFEARHNNLMLQNIINRSLYEVFDLRFLNHDRQAKMIQHIAFAVIFKVLVQFFDFLVALFHASFSF